MISGQQARRDTQRSQILLCVLFWTKCCANPLPVKTAPDPASFQPFISLWANPRWERKSSESEAGKVLSARQSHQDHVCTGRDATIPAPTAPVTMGRWTNVSGGGGTLPLCQHLIPYRALPGDKSYMHQRQESPSARREQQKPPSSHASVTHSATKAAWARPRLPLS